MAKYQFKQAALVGSGLGLAAKDKDGNPLKRSLGGHRHLYSKGVHEVPEEHLKDHTFVTFSKHGLIVKYVPDEKQKELSPASSDIARVSQAAAKSQLEPDAEIGGDEEHHAKKSKKGK